jgi:hypothetical protein
VIQRGLSIEALWCVSAIGCCLVAKESAGWWYAYPSEKYEFVSWDDEIPN